MYRNGWKYTRNQQKPQIPLLRTSCWTCSCVQYCSVNRIIHGYSIMAEQGSVKRSLTRTPGPCQAFDSCQTDAFGCFLCEFRSLLGVAAVICLRSQTVMLRLIQRRSVAGLCRLLSLENRAFGRLNAIVVSRRVFSSTTSGQQITLDKNERNVLDSCDLVANEFLGSQLPGIEVRQPSDMTVSIDTFPFPIEYVSFAGYSSK